MKKLPYSDVNRIFKALTDQVSKKIKMIQM